jgi:hypothetical protein
MSTHHKKNQIILDIQKLASTYNNSGISFICDNYGCKSTLHDLDLAYGLIELLVKNNYTLDSLLNASSSELSKTLGIDEQVATLICKATKKKKPAE